MLAPEIDPLVLGLPGIMEFLIASLYDLALKNILISTVYSLEHLVIFGED
jgi:hypothetical protein